MDVADILRLARPSPGLPLDRKIELVIDTGSRRRPRTRPVMAANQAPPCRGSGRAPPANVRRAWPWTLAPRPPCTFATARSWRQRRTVAPCDCHRSCIDGYAPIAAALTRRCAARTLLALARRAPPNRGASTRVNRGADSTPSRSFQPSRPSLEPRLRDSVLGGAPGLDTPRRRSTTRTARVVRVRTLDSSRRPVATPVAPRPFGAFGACRRGCRFLPARSLFRRLSERPTQLIDDGRRQIRHPGWKPRGLRVPAVLTAAGLAHADWRPRRPGHIHTHTHTRTQRSRTHALEQAHATSGGHGPLALRVLRRHLAGGDGRPPHAGGRLRVGFRAPDRQPGGLVRGCARSGTPAAFLGPGAGHGPSRSAAGATKSRSRRGERVRGRRGHSDTHPTGVPQLELETLWPVRLNKSLSRHGTRPLPVGLEPGEVTVAGSRAKSKTRTAAALRAD